jgi:hypothetical protein
METNKECFNNANRQFIISSFLCYVNLINNNNENNILIQIKDTRDILNVYEITMNLKECHKLIPVFKSFDNINDILNSIIRLFEAKKISIDKAEKKNSIEIKFSVFQPFGEQKSFKLDLLPKEINPFIIINNLFEQIEELKKEISLLKKENELLKKELNEEINNIKNENKRISELYEKYKILQNTPPAPISRINAQKMVKIKDLNIQSSISQQAQEKVFAAFKTLDNKYYLIYRNNNSSIIFYNLIDEERKEIQIQKSPISLIKHYIDNRNNEKKDIVLIYSEKHDNCKILDLSTWKCIFSKDIKTYWTIQSFAFTSKIDNFYLYMCTENEKDAIKYIDSFRKEKTLSYSEGQSYYMEVFKEQISDKNYLICCNRSCVLAFDVEKNELYKKFNDFSRNIKHLSAVLFLNKEVVNLIEGDEQGYINIWIFSLGIQSERIKIGDNPIYELLLWDEDNLVISDCDLSLFDFKKLGVTKIFKSDNKNEVYSLQNIILPKYGNCLVVQNKFNELITLWAKISIKV